MSWEMWLLFGLMVFILVILIALAMIVHTQNRRIGSLSHELKKSLESHAALEKSLQRALERHSERVVGTTEHLKTLVANSEAVASHHKADAHAARAELQKAHAEVKKLRSILERKERQTALHAASQEIPY